MKNLGISRNYFIEDLGFEPISIEFFNGSNKIQYLKNGDKGKYSDMNQELFEHSYDSIIKILRISMKSSFYKRNFEQANINPYKEITYEDFNMIPIIDKTIVRQNQIEMFTNLPDKFDINQLTQMKTGYERKLYLRESGLIRRITSGSTGTPLELLRSKRDSYQDNMMFLKNRKTGTNYDFKGRYLWLWPYNPIAEDYNSPFKKTPNFKLMNSMGDMYSVFRYSKQEMTNIVDIICSNQYEWLVGSPSILATLSKYILENSIPITNIKYIECQSEKLYEWQESIIIKAFNIKPVSYYSSNEVQFIGRANESGSITLFDKTCFVEIINDGSLNQIILTSLVYKDTPVIRYRIGDLGHWESPDKRQPHEYRFKLGGFRSNDFIYTSDGSKMDPIVLTDLVFSLQSNFLLTITAYKIEQVSVNDFIFYFNGSEINLTDHRIIEFLSEKIKLILRDEVRIKLIDFKTTDLVSKYKTFSSFRRS